MSFIKIQAAVRCTIKTRTSAAGEPKCDPTQVFQEAGVKYPTYCVRGLYLAYGYLRGVPYRVMEPTARPLFDSMGHIHKMFVSQIATLVSWADKDHPVTTEDIEKWMSKEEPAEHFAKRTAKEDAAKKDRMERRALHEAARNSQKVA